MFAGLAELVEPSLRTEGEWQGGVGALIAGRVTAVGGVFFVTQVHRLRPLKLEN